MIGRKIISLVIFLAVGFFSVFAYPNDPFAAPSNVIQDLESEHVYSIEEALGILQASPEKFKGRDIFLRAAVVDAVDGLGCEDFLLLTDPEFTGLYKRKYEPDLTPEEKETLKNIPIIRSGPSLSIPGDIKPNPDDCVYRGHFFDKGLESCEQGWSRFVITGVKP